jgi:hypothetical protein
MADADVLIRPIRYDERRFVYSTVRKVESLRAGGRFCHFETIRRLVDDLLQQARLTAAFLPAFEDPEEIQGFLVENPHDDTIEYFYIRRHFAEMPTPDLANKVIRTLLKERASVRLRHAPPDYTLRAMVTAGCVPTVFPRSV